MQDVIEWRGNSYFPLPDGSYYRIYFFRGKPRRHYYSRQSCYRCGEGLFQSRNTTRTGKYRPTCSAKCQYKGNSGAGSWNWAGGEKNKRGKDGGHIIVYAPEHPYARKGYVPKHRLIVESEIGRILEPEELVHHIDCNPRNNNLANLIVLTRGQHSKAHANLEKCVAALMETGALKFNRDTLMYEAT